MNYVHINFKNQIETESIFTKQGNDFEFAFLTRQENWNSLQQQILKKVDSKLAFKEEVDIISTGVVW